MNKPDETADGLVLDGASTSISCADCGWHVDAPTEAEAMAAALEHEEVEHGGSGINWVYVN